MQYTGFGPLRREHLDADPIVQFGKWFAAAHEANVELAEGAVLATVGASTQPSTRVVLLKSYGHDGFVFFTNYGSRKGHELEKNPRAALLFWWKEFGRQVRIEGSVERVSAEESDAYFASRPRGSQIGAWASEQSSRIENRSVLEQRAHDVEQKYDGREIPRPEGWGGYRIIPQEIEFWQGQPDRLHDRFLYERSGDGSWTMTRLAP